jgi:hypothetical protein
MVMEPAQRDERSAEKRDMVRRRWARARRVGEGDRTEEEQLVVVVVVGVGDAVRDGDADADGRSGVVSSSCASGGVACGVGRLGIFCGC